MGANERTKTTYQRVGRAAPCPVCSGVKGCLHDPAEGRVICVRVESPRLVPRLHGWLHRVDPTPEAIDEAARIVVDADRKPLDDATADARHALFSRLLAHPFCRLEARDRDELRRRGLDEGAIERHGYATYPDLSGLQALVGDVRDFAARGGLLQAFWNLPGVYARDKRGGGYVDCLSAADRDGHGALAIPVRDAVGRIVGLKLRRRNNELPPGDDDKYKWLSSQLAPSGAPLHVARPEGAADTTRLIITEGLIKANVAADRLGGVALGLPGISVQADVAPTLRRLRERGDMTAQTRVAIAFDEEPDKSQVAAWRDRLASLCLREGYAVTLLRWDPAQGKGLDDLLLSGEKPGEDPWEPTDGYTPTPDGLEWKHTDGKGTTHTTKLTNFTAFIAADVRRDDGAEVTRAFEMVGTLRGHSERFSVLAERFGGMGWVMDRLGAEAIVYPGQNIAQHARTAIQALSGDIPQRRVFTHTGWVETDEGWCYLHAGGAIGAGGAADGLDVDLQGDLARYQLPDPPAPGSYERAAIRAYLRTLDVAPEHVTFPLLAATCRAPLGDCDTSVFLSGMTGTGKTQLAALHQQCYGPAMSAQHLPGAWSSTANVLEALAFSLKDALIVVDDFVPAGSTADRARLHRDADRLLRGQGNGQGRARMRADTTLRPAKSPRGVIVGTGEETPTGHSLRARMVIVEVAPGDVRFGEAFSACQRDAAEGVYAAMMAGYLRHLAPQYEEWKGRLPNELVDLRDQAARSDMHRKTPSNTAQLALGLRSFLTYALAAGAITQAEREALWKRGWRALGDVAASQAAHQAASEPTTRFLELVGAAIVAGNAHVATLEGERPDTGGPSWGWRKADIPMAGGIHTDEWKPQGPRIGWLDGDNLYLLPAAAYAAAQRLGAADGDSLGVSAQTLGKRLKDKGLLASWDQTRKTNTVRKRIERADLNVWHISAGSLSTYFPPDKPDNKQSEGLWDVGESGIQADVDVGEGFAALSGDVQNPTTKPDNARRKPDNGPTWLPRVDELERQGLSRDAAIAQALRERGAA